MNQTGNRTCVYTVLIGDYEELNEQPVAQASEFDFICLTDNHELTSRTWKIVHVSAALPEDPARSSRCLKILGDPALAGYEQTIYVDNSIVLLKDPAHLLEYIADASFATCTHWGRATVLEEFRAVAAMGLDTPERVNAQVRAYALSRPDVLKQRPHANGILVRRQTDEVDRTMRLWMDHLVRYSRRDQLSLNFVLAETGLKTQQIGVNLTNCEWASWPHTSGRERGRLTPFQLELPAEPGGDGGRPAPQEKAQPSLRARAVGLLPVAAQRRVVDLRRRRTRERGPGVSESAVD